MEYFLKNIIILFVISTLIFSCNDKAEDIKSSGSNSISKDSQVAFKGDTIHTQMNKVKKKQTVNSPDYVPPNDGSSNGKWCNNRHKFLTNDSNCYFGKGLQKRNRYRWGRQNSE